MRKLWMMLWAMLIVSPSWAEEPKIHEAFGPVQSRSMKRDGAMIFSRGEGVPELQSPLEPNNNDAEIFLYYSGIDPGGRWILGLSGAMNYVPSVPLTVNLDGEVAFRITPQVVKQYPLKDWVKSFNPVSWLQHYTYFERTGVYSVTVKVPGVRGKDVYTQVLVKPHGEKYFECYDSAMDQVLTWFVVDWFELIPPQSVEMFVGGSSAGDAVGVHQYQIKETGIWIAFYRLVLFSADYNERVLYPFLASGRGTTAMRSNHPNVIMEVDYSFQQFMAPCLQASGNQLK